MSEKIEIMGISVEKCYAEDIMESINQHWNEDTLATYGVITMKLLIAAQKDEELKEYIETLDKAVADEPEIVKAADFRMRLGRVKYPSTDFSELCSGC